MIAFILKTPQQMRDYITKIRAFQILSGARICCSECRDTRWDVLHADHKDGRGNTHRNQLGMGGTGAGMRTYRWILKHPKTARKLFQLLCANCHQLKTTFGFVPIESEE